MGTPDTLPPSATQAQHSPEITSTSTGNENTTSASIEKIIPRGVDNSPETENGNGTGAYSSEADDQPKPTRGSRFDRKNVARYLREDVSLNHTDILIIACCFVSGLCDSSAYNSWACFVSMQTGNTVFLALGASNQPINRPYGWLKSLTSITVFLLGCFVCGMTRKVRPLSRSTLTLSFLSQALCIFIAAGLVNAHTVPDIPFALKTNGSPDFIELIPLAFLAFQSGFQIMTSRLLGLNEVPTTVLTSVYCDLASDFQFFTALNKNVKRNRRFMSVILFLVGGIIGGWLAKSGPGMQLALWIGGAVKFIIAMCWFFWKPKKVVALP